eukprot:8630635-Pyramimonas_sp.AAC.1
MSVVLSFSRARSSCFSLLVQTRRFYAYAIALGLSPAFRWIPAEFNGGGEGSRVLSTIAALPINVQGSGHGPEAAAGAQRA